MAALPRLRTAAYSALPSSCNCYHSLSSSSSHSPYSPYASTSATTLDDPPPPSYQALAPTWLSGRQPRRAKRARNEGEKQAVQRRRAVERRASLPFAAMEKDARAATKPSRQPTSDRTQISPFLPLVTRERNHLLSTFRQALYSRSSPSPASPSSRGAGGRRVVRAKRQAWDPDAVWVSLAKALRYPEELPELPHSHFPSSTRAPANLYDDDADFAASSPSTFTAEDGGFFSSAHPSTSPSSSASSSPPPHPLNPSSTDRPDLRTPLRLSFPELKRAFTILSSSRPRTREGLSRLLVVAELMARQKGAVMEDEGAGGGKEGGGGGVTRLRGGGKGLDEQDWAQLLLFAGGAMRTTRPEPEMQSVLGLYGQYLALEKEKRGRRGGGRGARELSLRQKKRKAVLYNVLLHLAARAKMFDLFEQVRGRMREEGLLEGGEREGEMGNVATSVAELGKAGLVGSPVEVLWSIFEVGVMVAAAEGRRNARGSKAAPFGSRAGMGPLWAAMAWWLAQRGHLDDAQRMYDAMKAQRRVDLRSLRPAAIALEDDDALSAHPAPPPFFLFPPPPSQGVVTGSIQACCFRGDFEGAMRMLREVLAGKDRRVRPSVHVFLPIFRMFGRFGKAPSSSTGGRGGGAGLSRTLLSGDQVNAYASRHTSSSSSSPLRSLSSALSSSTANDAHPSNPLTLSALSSLFDLFLSLAAPTSSTHPALPFSGQRTAPSAKEIFWILFAFEKLSGGDSAVVVEVYGLLVGKFRDKAEEGWTGWRMNKRVQRMVRGHVEKIEELQRRWEELQ